MDKKISLLIAEDEAIHAMVLEQEFLSAGYEVFSPVATADEAVAAARKCAPDFIIMDVNLAHETSGIDAAIVIRSFSPAVIIFMTGYAAGEIMEQMRNMDRTFYVSKPVMVHDIIAIINSSQGKC